MPAALRRKGASLSRVLHSSGNDFRPSRDQLMKTTARAVVRARAVRRLDAAFKAIQSKGR